MFIPSSNQLYEVRNSIIHDLFSNKLRKSGQSKFHDHLVGKTGQLFIKLNVIFTRSLLYIDNITKRTNNPTFSNSRFLHPFCLGWQLWQIVD